MTQQTTHPMAEAPVVELPATDLEKVVAGKDGNYGWIGIYTGKEARRMAQLHPSPPVIG
jgi:hypothetical protein